MINEYTDKLDQDSGRNTIFSTKRSMYNQESELGNKVKKKILRDNSRNF